MHRIFDVAVPIFNQDQGGLSELYPGLQPSRQMGREVWSVHKLYIIGFCWVNFSLFDINPFLVKTDADAMTGT